MSAAARLGRAWRTFWFSEASALPLAATRVFVASHSLWVLLSRDYAGITRLPVVFRASIPETVRWRYLIFESHPSIEVAIQWIAVGTLLMAIVGVLPRIACFVAALVLYHLAPLETVMWTAAPYARSLTLAPIALLVLAFSPSGDALSVMRPRGSARSWAYRWPVRLIQLFVVQIYFFSGIGKLMETGLGWGSAENIREWLLWFNLTAESSVFSSLGLWIADQPVICAAIGLGTLLFELVFPLVLFVPRSVAVLVPIAILFHVGTLFSMNIYVGEAWYLFVFIDWSRFGVRRA